ncbi:MAG: four-carbon acid sugar kinase family protein [Runella sp.]
MNITTKTIVLDDDPTGTQTVQDVAVLTVWDVATLAKELRSPAPLFFILTNTRAMPEAHARALNVEICQNLLAAREQTGINFDLISRGDSTLRGHFPAEPEAIEQGMGITFDAWFLIPFFEEGGRITRQDVHYVREGQKLIPAADTPFAQDATFGFRHSNLKEYVEEKTNGNIKAETVASIALEELKSPDIQPLIAKISHFTNRQVVVVNAESWRDLIPLAVAVRHLPHKRFLFRTAASWVKAVKFQADGIERFRPIVFPQNQQSTGGLIVVGSYVPKTTRQLQILLHDTRIRPLELDTARLLAPHHETNSYILEVAAQIDTLLSAKIHVVVYTSRVLIKDTDPLRSLEIGNRVSEGLVALVQKLKVRPRFLVAKGGITSSDVATKGLNIKRAVVRGPLLAGVPVWESGPESRLPGLHYVVFPGNVGHDDALHQAFEQLI